MKISVENNSIINSVEFLETSLVIYHALSLIENLLRDMFPHDFRNSKLALVPIGGAQNSGTPINTPKERFYAGPYFGDYQTAIAVPERSSPQFYAVAPAQEYTNSF